MSSAIREMVRADAEAVIDMMRVFYASPAVQTNGSQEIFMADVEGCVGGCPYLEGYIFHDSGKIQGYAMVAKSFSTELGRPCIWIEDLYIKSEYRGLGIGSAFFDYIGRRYPDVVFKLEVERENKNAVRVYEKCGYDFLPYLIMRKDSGAAIVPNIQNTMPKGQGDTRHDEKG